MSQTNPARASFEAAVREYHKQTGCNILSNDNASHASLAGDSSPADIKAFFQLAATRAYSTG
ncbi:hypothetical protein CYLTODRAFT_417784 [Cylindrobasidium torrendii FP15055 ss-10]|uniref:Uncharacterized protein n=1 Tax=Cylindrobasidium torrendii FP15055 ss-10 TaxID=1314674 RepID=A0A0D7BQ55_9AGAR|nr:hypothetical protein CYLTODRAFT_417784 [Cylindrobasidium torrendii FP15055 ss-10]